MEKNEAYNLCRSRWERCKLYFFAYNSIQMGACSSLPKQSAVVHPLGRELVISDSIPTQFHPETIKKIVNIGKKRGI